MRSRYLQAALLKAAAELSAKDMSALLADRPNILSEYLLLPSADRRAGRARAAVEATGGDPSLLIKYPQLANLLYGGGATLAGGGLGALLGGAVGGVATVPAGGVGSAPGALFGAAAGAGLGATVGTVYTAFKRRKMIDELEKSLAGRSADASKVVPTYIAPHWLTRGVHMQGRADVKDVLERKGIKQPENPLMTAGAIGSLIPYVGPLAALGYMGGSVALSDNAWDRLKR